MTTDRTVTTNHSPTLEGWNVGDFGLEGSDVTITCVTGSLADAWKSIAAWFSRTPAILELGDVYDGWFLEGIPTKHSSVVRKSDGDVPTEYYEYTVLFTTIIPKFQSTTKRVRGRYIDGSMSWSSDNTRPGNQIENGSFEQWNVNTDMTWTSQNPGADNTWKCIAYNEILDTVVIGADSGTGNRVKIQINNGTWKTPSGLGNAANCDNNWRGACWVPSTETLPNGRIVMVADSGTGNRVMTSDDCDIFTARTSAADNAWCSVCYIPPNATLPDGRLVACAYSGTNRIMYSDDVGETWMAVEAANEITNWISICYSESLERLVCVGYTGDTTHQIQYSDDYGETWTEAVTPAYQTWTSVCRAETIGLYVACSKSGTQKIMTSANGITEWTLQTIPTGAQTKEWRCVCCADVLGLLVAICDVGTDNNAIISTDGVNWTETSTPHDYAWWAIKYIQSQNTETAERVIDPVDVSIVNKVSTIQNWNFSEWSGGLTDVAPDNWTLITTGQSRSTYDIGGTYSYKITGDGSSAVRGSISQATANITPGTYTIGTWVCVAGATQGNLHIKLAGTTAEITVPYTYSSNNYWSYMESTQTITETNPSVLIYVDGTPNTGSRWYVESVIVCRDATAISGIETDNGGSITQQFTYTPTSVLPQAVFQTRFYGIDVVNSDGSPAYPITNIVIKIDGVETTDYVRIGRYSTIDVSGLSAAPHLIEIGFVYTEVLGRFVAVAGSGTTYRIMTSSDYGTALNIPPDGWDLISEGQTYSDSLLSLGEKSYLIKGDGVTADIGSISQPVSCDASTSYILSVYGAVRGITSGKLAIDIFSNGSITKQVYWDSSESGNIAILKQFIVKYNTSPLDAIIRIHGIETPNIGSELYVDSVTFEKISDHELNTVGNSIITYGSVDTVPDYEVKAVVPAVSTSGVTTGSTVNWDSGSNVYTSAAPYYKIDDTSLEVTTVLPAKTDGSKYHIKQVSTYLCSAKAGVLVKCAVNILCASLFGGVETRIAEWISTSTDYVYHANLLNLTSGTNESVTFKYFLKTANTSYRAIAKQFGYQYAPETTYTAENGTSSVEIYNAADPSTVLELCNTLQYGCAIQVNADYTGQFEYSTNLEDDTYKYSISLATGGTTYNSSTRRATMPTGSVMEFEFDTKFPITGIPFVEMLIVSGRPKYSICVDETWYEIDSNATADLDSELIYKELNNATNLQLAGETIFTVRIEPTGTESLVFGSIFVHCDLVTIDAPRPKIYATGEPNTFTAVVSGNAIVCNIKYRDRNLVI